MPSNIKMPEGDWFVPSGYALHNLIYKAIMRGATVFMHEAIELETKERFVLGTYFQVPEPQKAGTLFQQITYAKMKAWEFMKNNNLK